jgi:hypothetical protein
LIAPAPAQPGSAARKPGSRVLTPEFQAKNAEHRKLLEERVAYHEAKIAQADRKSA